MKMIVATLLTAALFSESLFTTSAFVSRNRPVSFVHDGGLSLQGESENSDANSPDFSVQKRSPAEQFLESASLKGSNNIRSMSIEERTKRAMLAEAMEDRIFTMYDGLEAIIGQDGTLPTSEEDRLEVERLATEIKASQIQYEKLVSGKPSSMLVAIDEIGDGTSKD